MTAFSSPWAKWQELIDQYEEAVLNGEEELKVWWNTVLGLPYEMKSGVIDVSTMEEHRMEYPAELPEGVLVLTCGVDTQDDRLECEVVGWGVGKESWGIEYRIIYGDPGKADVWNVLDDFLQKQWNFANGEQLRIACTCIDSAGHHTDDVYNFCRGKTRRNIFAIVGRGAPGLPSVGKPTRSNRYHVPLFTLCITGIKGDLFSRLRTDKPGPGYCHFPNEPKNRGHRGYDATYFKGLLSERMEVERTSGRSVVTWVPRYPGIRNEPLDVRVYATGAIDLINPNFDALAKRRARRGAAVEVTSQEQRVVSATVERKPVKRVVRRGIRVISRGMV